MSKAISRRDFLKVTGAVGAAGLLAACGGNGGAASSTASSAAEAASVAGLSSDPVTLTMSWWGGESRHNAYQEALKAFSAEHTTITVAVCTVVGGQRHDDVAVDQALDEVDALGDLVSGVVQGRGGGRSSSAITTAASPRSPWALPSPRPARTPLRLLP